MPARVSTNVVGLEMTLPPVMFPVLVKQHLTDVPATLMLETQAQVLRNEQFAEPLLTAFIQAVCKWGGYAGIAGRVFKHNSAAVLREQFTAAMIALDSPTPDERAAIAAIYRIHGLGSPSFAFKHLRFLRPDLCPVLDTIVSERLGYAFNADGYKQFATDCAGIDHVVGSTQHDQSN